MAKPWVHAKNSARRYGGVADDYIAIHNLMDNTKGTVADNRHRAMTHNSWFISAGGPLELIFGHVITNSDGREVSVRDIGEQHILEDFSMKFIPTPQDWLHEIPLRKWMNNGKDEVPPSFQQIENQKQVTHTPLVEEAEDINRGWIVTDLQQDESTLENLIEYFKHNPPQSD